MERTLPSVDLICAPPCQRPLLLQSLRAISFALQCPLLLVVLPLPLPFIVVFLRSKLSQHPLHQLLDLGISIRIFVQHSSR